MSIFDEPPLRDDLRGKTPYGAPQLNAVVRLDHNESPYQLPETVSEAIEKALGSALRELHRYPDREAHALREDLANYLGHGLTAANIWPANGSNEAQQQVLQAFGGPGRTVLGFGPTHAMHNRLALATGTKWIDGYRSSTFQLTVEAAKAQVRVHQPDLVFLCAPNNPTGTPMGLDVVDTVVSEAPGMVIVDEAFAEFAGVPTAASLVSRYPRLVVTRTLSKAFGLAGLHLGYLAASHAIVDALALVRLPHHLSALTQAAARAALAHAPALLAHVDSVRTERDRLTAGLRELGLTVADSAANFVLFGRFQDQHRVWQALAERSVLVRDVGMPGWLRVTVGTPRDTDAFLGALSLVPDGI